MLSIFLAAYLSQPGFRAVDGTFMADGFNAIAGNKNVDPIGSRRFLPIGIAR